MRKITSLSLFRGKSLLVVVLAASILSSCDDVKCIRGEGNVETRTLNLEPFSRVEANGDFKVYITQGDPQKVEVKGEPNILDLLQTNVSNNTWEIEYDECVRRSKQVEVYITIPQVQSLYLNGSGRLYGQNEFTANELEVELNGSGKIECNVIASKVISRVTGSGEMKLQGEAPLYSVNISGSGKSAAFGLQADNVTAQISGSGTAEVSATDALSADITGSGIVYYLGSPQVTTNISGSGKVVKK